MVVKSPEDQARDIVNASGFVFQLAVAHEVREQSGTHGWSVRDEEHPYATPNRSGYIDLILERGGGSTLLIVECKRTRGGIWAFIATGGLNRRHVRRLRIASRSGRKRDAWWEDFSTEPSSPEAAFCAVRGSEDRQAPMLENLAGRLLESLECVAGELLGKATEDLFQCMLIPMIVTNARLMVCSIANPEAISLTEGDLPPNTRFTEVGYVRFRKSLGGASLIGPTRRWNDPASKESERTVLVVNAEHLTEFLGWCQPRVADEQEGRE